MFLFLFLAGLEVPSYVLYTLIVLVFGGFMVYVRKVIRPRLLREREAIQSQIRKIEDAH